MGMLCTYTSRKGKLSRDSGILLTLMQDRYVGTLLSLNKLFSVSTRPVVNVLDSSSETWILIKQPNYFCMVYILYIAYVYRQEI